MYGNRDDRFHSDIEVIPESGFGVAAEQQKVEEQKEEGKLLTFKCV